MSDENFSYAPPGADATANTPAPQPWLARHERMSLVKDLLNAKDREGVNLPSLYDADREIVDEIYTDEALSSHLASNSWARYLAEGRSVLGFNISGFVTTAADREGVAKRVAQGIVALNRIPGVASRFDENPEWPKNIFKELVKTAVIAQNAAHKAGLYNDQTITDLILSSKEVNLTQWTSNPKTALTTDSLTNEQLVTVAYGIHAMERLNQTRLSLVAENSGLYKKVDDATKGQLTSIASINGPLYAPKIINAPSDIARLHGVIAKSNFIQEGYKAPLQVLATASVNHAGETTEPQGDQDQPTLEAQVSSLADRASYALERADAEVAEAERKLEAARQSQEAAKNRVESVRSVADDVGRLNSLRYQTIARQSLLVGLAEDPEFRVKELDALTLEPPFEGPSEDFYRTLAQIDPGKIAAVYEIDKQQIELSMIALREASDLMGGTTPAALLRPIFDHHINLLWESIGQDKLSSGRVRLKEASQPIEGIEQLEAEIKQKLAQIFQDIGQ